VEHAHATLKMWLQVLKGGNEVIPPASQLHKALYTLNFLNCPEQGLTPTESHWQSQEPIVRPQVLWKNVLTCKWHGTDPVVGSRACLCFSWTCRTPSVGTMAVCQASWIPWFQRWGDWDWKTPRDREWLRLTPPLTRRQPIGKTDVGQWATHLGSN
jgi:hypothetical protein